MSTIATHQATVIESSAAGVRVKMEVASACAACHAHGGCGFAESAQKELLVPTRQWKDYQTGDTVTLSISEQMGIKAVFWAYVLPSVVLITVFACCYSALGDVASALITLCSVGVYTFLLWLFRAKLGKKFTIAITHSTSDKRAQINDCDTF